MANVGGLRPTQQGQPTVRQKKGRLAVRRDSSERAALRPSAAPVDTYIRPGAVPDVSSNAERLSAALAQLNPAIGRIAGQQYQKMEEEQMQKLRFYTEQFMKDKEDGAITAAQVKEVFPELVPTVAARIAQATGEVEARRWVQDQIQTILESDDIRLNTARRQEAMEQIRTSAREIVGNNEFYGTGFLSQLDSSLREFETAWMRETAAHQERIQAESFSNQVADALLNGGDLLEIDNQWKESSSLNHLERNALVVDAAVAQAMATGNERLLDRVPDRFLNADSKAKFEQAKTQIQQARYTEMVRARQMQQWAREEETRRKKIDVLGRMAQGEHLNPADFYRDPEMFEYVLRMNSQPMTNATVSVRNAESLKARILRASTSGGYMEAFKDDPNFVLTFGDEENVSEDGLRDYILNHDGLNHADKQKLITEVPMLMEGVNFVRNPDFDTHFENTLGSDLKVFGNSVQGQVLQTMGVNVQGDVQNAYRERLRQEVMAHIEENNALPLGTAKLEIMKRAEDAASARLQFIQQNYQSLLQERSAELSNTNQPSNRPQPQTEPSKPSKEADENVVVLPNGVEAIRVE